MNILNVLLALSLTVSSGLGFSKVWVFGDSLSDTGNFQIIAESSRNHFFLPPAYQENKLGFQRISNGKVTAEFLAKFYGQKELRPALAGGTNFATFAARIEDPTSSNCQNAVIPDLGCQVSQFLDSYNGSNLGSEQIIILIGANDLSAALSSDNPQNAIQVAVGEYSRSISRLLSAGVKNILLLNVPDASESPVIRAQGENVQAAVAALTQAINAGISSVATAHSEIKLIDLYTISNQLASNSNRLGFQNTTDSCFNANLSASFTLDIEPVGFDATPNDFSDNPSADFSNGCNKGRASTYAYWDYVHPTTRVHKLWSQKIIKELKK